MEHAPEIVALKEEIKSLSDNLYKKRKALQDRTSELIKSMEQDGVDKIDVGEYEYLLRESTRNTTSRGRAEMYEHVKNSLSKNGIASSDSLCRELVNFPIKQTLKTRIQIKRNHL